MNLFINAVSESGTLLLFDDDRQVISEKNIEILGNESSKLISIIDKFLSDNNIVYNSLENIVVVNGPGSFTGVRTIVLAINSMNYILDKYITPVSFFELFNNYPIVKSSSRRDLFVKYGKNDTIKIVKNNDVLKYLEKNHVEKCYGDVGNNIVGEELNVERTIDYSKIIKNIEFQKNKLIEPLYIKKPNIS